MLPRFFPIFAVFPLALSAAACSDPPPTPAAMGISLSLSAPLTTEVSNVGSRSCPAGGSGAFTYTIGQPLPNKTIEDGTDNVKVDCTVRGDNSFSAQASGLDGHTKEILSMNVSGRITDKNSATANMGQLTFYTPNTLALQTQTSQYPGCTFGPVTTLKKGAILTEIKCPIIVALDDSTSGCRAEGTIAFEYCKTGEEEN
jgi:hypothetical protein